MSGPEHSANEALLSQTKIRDLQDKGGILYNQALQCKYHKKCKYVKRNSSGQREVQLRFNFFSFQAHRHEGLFICLVEEVT